MTDIQKVDRLPDINPCRSEKGHCFHRRFHEHLDRMEAQFHEDFACCWCGIPKCVIGTGTHGQHFPRLPELDLEKGVKTEVRAMCYRKMALNMAKLISRDVIEDGFVRVEGRMVCTDCGLYYNDHPEMKPTFHYSCDGRIVKT
jgi:hypothetical protein